MEDYIERFFKHLKNRICTARVTAAINCITNTGYTIVSQKHKLNLRAQKKTSTGSQSNLTTSAEQ